MKPELKHFPILKSEDEFPQWLERLNTACNAVQLGEVCDMTYVPSNWVEVESFVNKCKWGFWMLQQTVKTPAGINIIRNHLTDKDARMVIYELEQLHKISATADIRAGEILNDIVGLRMERTTRGGYEAFIIGFNKKMSDYNDVVRFNSQRLAEETMRAYLERAIAGVKGFSEITDRENDRIAEWGYGARFTYPVWLHLVKEKARTMDKQMSSQAKAAARRGSVNLHQLLEALDVGDSDSSDTDLLEVNAHRFLPGSRMDKATWDSLSQPAKEKWDTFSDEDKATILSYVGKKNAQEPPNKKARPGKRSVNFHEGIISSPDEDSEEETAALEVNASSVQEINEVKSKVHAADPRRMLGQQTPAAKKSTDKTTDKKPATPTAKAFHAGLTLEDQDDACEIYDDDISLGISDAGSSWGDSGVNNPHHQVDDYWGAQEDQFF